MEDGVPWTNEDAAHLYAHWVCVANAERRELEGMIAAERRRAARWNRIANFAVSVIAAVVVVLSLPVLLPLAAWKTWYGNRPANYSEIPNS